MNEKFVFITVLPETRDDLRFIAKEKETNIYKLIRRMARAEKEKILNQSNASVRTVIDSDPQIISTRESDYR